MIKISQRLLHLADMVSRGAILADIGTDHAYLPIYLLLEGRIKRAFAMDLREGPLLRAKEHTEAYGLGGYITLRRSNGLKELAPKEADSIVIAGMGGGVMTDILSEGRETASLAKELILQPQSEIKKVREFLFREGYCIDREDIVLEDGKYYPMMHVLTGENKNNSYTKEEWELAIRYGRILFEGGNGTLISYLLFQKKQYEAVLSSLAHQDGEAALARRAEIERELFYIHAARERVS